MAAEVKDGGVDAEIGESRGVDGGVGNDNGGATQRDQQSRRNIGCEACSSWDCEVDAVAEADAFAVAVASCGGGQAKAGWDVDAIFGRFAAP